MVLLCVFLIIFVIGCFPGPNFADTIETQIDDAESLPLRSRAGFFRGIWHGVIAPFSFVISLFTDRISLYEVYNNGGWYDFGFVIGAGILFGSSGGCSISSSCKKKKKKDNEELEEDDKTESSTTEG